MTDEKKTEKVRILGVSSEGETLVASELGRIGVTKKAKDGQPLAPTDDMVSFKETDDPNIFTMTTEYEGQANREQSKGPAKFATELYRNGWDAVFGTKPKKEEMN